MLCLSRLWKPAGRFLVSSAFLGAFYFAAPAANAQTLPQFDPAELNQQVISELAKVRISTDPQAFDSVTQQIAADVDHAIKDAQNAVNTQLNNTVPPLVSQKFTTVVSTEEAPTNPNPLGLDKLEELTRGDFTPIPVDPNYLWKNDKFSKIAAMKPDADFVLHRVPGSYFDAPRIPEESNEVLERRHSLYGPGTPLYVGSDMMCTLTVAGTDSSGRKVGLTAGHCGEVGEQVVSADSWQAGPTGTIAAKNTALDYAVVEFNDKAEITNDYNGVRAWGIGGKINPGDVTCKRGVATGTTCGVVLLQERKTQLNHVCAMAGDSGAPLFKNGRVIGAITGGVGNFPCRTPWQGILHAPTEATNMDAVLSDLNRRGGVGAGFSLQR